MVLVFLLGFGLGVVELRLVLILFFGGEDVLFIMGLLVGVWVNRIRIDIWVSDFIWSIDWYNSLSVYVME